MAVLIFSILIVATGCVTTTTTTERNFLRYENNDRAKVFQASMQALNDIGFSVISSDSNGGVIIAERSAFAVGMGVYRFNIFVNRSSSGSIEVEVSFISPSMSLGKIDYIGNFIKALKERTPDVVLVTTKKQ
ncbi:MAG: hypothetical protein NUV64_01610 [Parcubacteria group bacterium]|nr:hypothetical protein [Parcubacteria group bacterium]